MTRTVALSRRTVLGAGLAGTASFLGGSAAWAASALDILVIGDWGNPSDGQTAVAAAMSMVAARLPPRLIISTGDNFYPRGVTSATDKSWKSAFEDVYNSPELACPWYAVLGNHDRTGNIQAEIERSSIDPRWHMPARFYAHREQMPDGGAVEFFFFDTTLIAEDGGDAASTTDQAQFEWLEQGLATSSATWRLVVGHHPVFSGGHHGNTPGLVARLKPLLDRYKVQAYLNGHDHDLQHVVVDQVHYLTAGAGAKTRPTGKITGSVFAAATLGFLHVALTAQQMDIAFIGTKDEPLHTARIRADRSEG